MTAGKASTINTSLIESTSPCIGICSVTVGDSVCRGCFRTLDDIACWSQLDTNGMAERLGRRQTVMAQTFSVYFKLLDETALQAQWLRHIATPPEPKFPEEAWMQLLQKGSHRMQRTEAYGVQIRDAHTDQPIKAVWRAWRQSMMAALGG